MERLFRILTGIAVGLAMVGCAAEVSAPEDYDEELEALGLDIVAEDPTRLGDPPEAPELPWPDDAPDFENLAFEIDQEDGAVSQSLSVKNAGYYYEGTFPARGTSQRYPTYCKGGLEATVFGWIKRNCIQVKHRLVGRAIVQSSRAGIFSFNRKYLVPAATAACPGLFRIGRGGNFCTIDLWYLN